MELKLEKENAMKKLVAMIGALSLYAASALAGSPVNVNSASAEEIAEGLDGVGMTKAEAIVAYRTENGPFKTQDELVAVKGIGIRTVDRNAQFIVLSDETEAGE